MSDVIINLSIAPPETINVVVEPLTTTINVTVITESGIAATVAESGVTLSMLEFLNHVSVDINGNPLWDGQPWQI